MWNKMSNGFGLFWGNRQYCYRSYKTSHKLSSHTARTRVHSDLHRTDLRVNALHKVNDEANHLLSVVVLQNGIRYKEADVVALE